jgi:hypothetical protein
MEEGTMRQQVVIAILAGCLAGCGASASQMGQVDPAHGTIGYAAAKQIDTDRYGWRSPNYKAEQDAPMAATNQPVMGRRTAGRDARGWRRP